MPAPRILFVCDAGPLVGGGHVMRSLTLAAALAAKGAQPAFLTTPAVAALLDAFAPRGIARRPAAGAAPEALAAAAARAEADLVVFDHYGLSADLHREGAAGRSVLVIDDLADRPLEADLVLDPGPLRRSEDYAGLVGEETRVLTGPAYALVRPEFAERRGAALARRAAGGPARQVLVSMGLTDVGAATARVVERLLPILGQGKLEAVAAEGAPSRARLAPLSDNRLTLTPLRSDMAERMERADAAVGAGGSTTWERCVLGLPSLIVILAENQRAAAEALGAQGAALVCDLGAPDFEPVFDAKAEALLRDPRVRAGLSQASAALCDGEGAGRVADACLALV